MVEAETGAIGGDVSHEFMVWADTGEDIIVFCEKCGYAANRERAAFKWEGESLKEEPQEPQKVYTPNVRTIEEVSDFLKISQERLLKSLVYKTSDGEFVLFLVPGDRELNEAKAARALGVESIEMALPHEVYEIAGASVGFVGPCNLKKKVKIVADRTVQGGVNFVSGANEDDYHVINITPGRDFNVDLYADVVFAKEGDLCPNCGEPLKFSRGIEVGHIFKLGTKYSAAMNATFFGRGWERKAFHNGMLRHWRDPYSCGRDRAES